MERKVRLVEDRGRIGRGKEGRSCRGKEGKKERSVEEIEERRKGLSISFGFLLWLIYSLLLLIFSSCVISTSYFIPSSCWLFLFSPPPFSPTPIFACSIELR